MTEEDSQLNESSPLLQIIPEKKYGYGLSFQNVINLIVFDLKYFLTIFFF